jgi:sec-independent protein translocase protein TatB
MFEIAWSELLLVLIVAIVVVGPKELPGMLRTFGRMMGKLRRSADDFRRQFDESVRDAGGEDLQRELNELRRNNPLNEIRNTIEQAAREASEPPRLPTPESYLGKPEETPAVSESSTTSDKAAALPSAETAAPAIDAPQLKPTAPEAAIPPKDQAAASPGHEPVINGQHRPLN